MEFYRLWRILVGNMRILIWLPIFATIIGLLLTYVLPEQYKSTALVLVRPAEEIKFDPNAMTRKEEMGFPVGQAAPLDAPGKTYMEVIKSPAVAVKIVEALKLYIKEPKPDQTAFEALRDKVKDWASELARTTRNYFKYGRDIPATPFDRAVEDVENKLDASTRKDTYAFDISYRSSNPKQAAAVANMAAQIFIEHSAEAYRTEAEHAREFLGTELETARKALEKARNDVLAYKNSGATFDLKSEYTDKLKNLSDLQTTLAKDDGKLAGLKRSFKSDSPEVLTLQAEMAALTEQISKLQAQVVDYPEKEAKLNAINLTERMAEDSYEFFRKRYEEARVKEAAISAEIRIVSPAEPAIYPIKPVKYIYAGLSFIMALVAAIGWVLFAEQLNPRVRTVHDLDDTEEAPVLGAIPILKRSAWSAEPRA